MRIATLAAAAALRPAAVIASGPPATGRLERHAGFASRHVAARDVVVWLPPGYDGRRRHDVLYMHDGQNLFDPDSGMGHGPWAVDVHLARLLAAGRIRPTLVVGIDNTPARRREYLPEPAFAALPADLRTIIADAAGGPPLSDTYLRFLVEELKPFIDGRYRTRPGRATTTLMGSSMGGLISLHGVVRYPEVFGAAGCLSTHWPLSVAPAIVAPGHEADAARAATPYIDWLGGNLPPAGAHRLYFDHGTIGLDALYAPFQQRLDTLLRERGYRNGVDLESRVYDGADHNEAAWRARLETPLSFLLQR